MKASAIKELAAARRVPLICAAFNEGTVQTWDLLTRKKTGAFAASFASGARNLSIHPSGESVVTGVSSRKGKIASYKTSSGERMWLQDQLPYPARIRFGSSEEHVFCTVDNRRVDRIDARTGSKTGVFQNTSLYVEGPNGRAFTSPSSGPDYLLRNGAAIPIPKLTSYLLDVAFGVDRLCITESRGPLRCLSSRTGEEHWRYTPPDGSHALTLHFNRLDGCFYGVVWHYEKNHFRYLLRFDAETGKFSSVRNLNSWEEAFSEATQQLVTSSGEIIDLSNGEAIGELDFPLQEYPDRPGLA